MTNEFLPKDYKVSSGSGDSYMRFEVGENRLRILTSPILGWEWWVDSQGNPREKGARPQQGDKPVRVPKDGEVPVGAVDTVKEFWAMPVWNYKEEKVQILELTQKGIMRTVTALARDKEWGSPLNYDLNVIRQGEGLDTEYEVVPAPPKELVKEAKEAWESKTVRLEALYENGDPFGATPVEGSDPSGLVS